MKLRRSSRCFSFLIACVFVMAPILACQGAEAPKGAGGVPRAKAPAGPRKLTFPETSIGQLHTRDEASTPGGAWKQIGEAQGVVEIPAGQKVGLRVSKEALAKGALEAIAKLEPGALDVLSLRKTGLTNEQLAALKGLKPEGLILAATAVTDEGLANLKEMTTLQRLDVSGTKVTNPGIENLKGLEKMLWLDLAKTRIGDAAIGHIKGMKDLQILYANHLMLGDAAMAHLAEIKSLRRLSLASTKITDKGLAALQGLPNLEWLSLRAAPKITDKSVPTLGELKNLRYLDIRSTKITAGAARKLKEALPKTEIKAK